MFTKKLIKPGPAISVFAKILSGSVTCFKIDSAIFRGGIFWIDAVTIAIFVEKSPCDSILGTSTSISGSAFEGKSPFSYARVAALRIRFFIFCFI